MEKLLLKGWDAIGGDYIGEPSPVRGRVMWVACPESSKGVRSPTPFEDSERATHASGPRSSQAFTKKANTVRDVGDALLLVADFAFDAERALEADFLEPLDEFADIRLPLAERDFFAPGSWHLRPVGILDVNAANVRP